jgi:hypothetical protein
LSEESVTGVAGGVFAPGHLGELTQIVPFEMVDAALAETGRRERRTRRLPARVVVYLLLAAGLFPEIGLGGVWSRLCSGLPAALVTALPAPAPSAVSAARARLGVAPLKALFDLLRGAQTGSPRRPGVFWRSWLLTAVDGTVLCCPDTAANLTVFAKPGGVRGHAAYPAVRVLGLIACGTRTVIDAVFGSDRVSELTYAEGLAASTGPGMLVLADRNFDAHRALSTFTATGADVLIRAKDTRRPRVCRRLADGSVITRIGAIEVRVITAVITVAATHGTRRETYRLITTVLDPDIPALEIVGLYHQRWEIETSFYELKATSQGGRVLRSRTPTGVAQELYALLITYQALRIAISDTTWSRPDLDPDRGSFTVARHAARDQLTAAAGIVAGATVDLVGAIGRHVLGAWLPARRARSSPRVVKRALSKYAASTIHGRRHGPSHQTKISIDLQPILTTPTPA